MRRTRILLSFIILHSLAFAQLKDIKILLPKEVGFSYYEFVQFLPDEKYFVVCANSLAVFNTETAEIIDEVDLTSNARNLSVSKDGKFISFTLNNELYIYSFKDQKLELFAKVMSDELLKGLPNGEWYKAMQFSASFFTDQPGQLYISIASFTLLYDFQNKKVTSNHSFKIGDYIMHGAYLDGRNTAVLALISGTNTSIVKQPLNDLGAVTNVLSKIGTPLKLRLHDSLLMCFTADKYFVMNMDNGKVVHEVRVPKIKYDPQWGTDKKYFDEMNKRPALSSPDTVNFARDEYVSDIDYNPANGTVVYATNKEIKSIDLKTKKCIRYKTGYTYNLRISKGGNRMIANGFTSGRSLRVMKPANMKLIAEKLSQTTLISNAKMSPNNRWLIMNSNKSAVVWDMNNFTKYCELKDQNSNDSSMIYNFYFLNDSELVVNSGNNFKQLKLSIYNIQKKKFTKLIKKTGFATISGFMNNEFYYCDNTSLYIINLKTLAEEKYSGMYSLAALPQYQMINFTDNLVFVPESGKYKIINRKTKAVEYENSSWNLNVRVIISPDEKNVFTTGVVKTKKVFGGNEVEMEINAVIRIDMAKKAIVSHYAETYYPYDFVMRDNGKSIGIWYVKYDIEHYSDSLKEALYSVYDIETAKVISTKTLTQSKEIITNHHTSESGKYFAMDNYLGNSLKIFNESGNLLMDIGDLKIPMPKLFFNESLDRLIITTYQNPLATFVDLRNKKIIGQLVNANDDQYFLVTSDLHYLGSKDFIKNIRFKYQSEIFSFEQFDAKLNQPHKVLKAFGCKDTVLIKAYETAFLKRMKLLGIRSGDDMNFKSFPTISSVIIEDDKANFVKFSISANKGKSKLAELEVHNNGTLVYSEKISEDQKNKFDKIFVMETSSGINRYEFIIKDEAGYESPRITRFYNNTTIVKPNLYLVVIASEKFKNNKYDLSYAVKDATDMANTMSNSKSFGKIEVKKMFNQAFTVDSLSTLEKFFSKASINDVVMVFFAGHGYLDDDLSYYFPTYYTDFTDPKINSVAYKSFETLFKGMKPIRKLMFIDACFSGEVDEETIYNSEEENTNKDTTRAAKTIYTTFAQSTALEMSKAIFSDLRQNSGATIISSAGGTEAAFEGEKWNNGLFTHCLLEGISNYKADKNSDKKVSLSELQRYVAEEVYRLSDGKQSPTYRMENTVLDYELWEY
jgi:hypothetical protein